MEPQIQYSGEVHQDAGFGAPQDVEKPVHDDEHHGAKSILKKVTAKARKIKNTLKHHGHNDRDYDPQEVPHDFDLEEEEEDDDEPQGDHKVLDHGHISNERTDVPETVMSDPRAEPDLAPVSPMITEKRVHQYLGIKEHVELEEDPHAPNRIRQDHDPSNYQTKATDPTGAGHEADCGPMLASLSEMNVRNQPDKEQENLSSLDDSMAESESLDQDSNSGGYTGKFYSTIASTAATAKNMITSKLGIGQIQQQDVKNEAKDDQNRLKKGTSVKEYVTEKLKPGDEDRALSSVISENFHSHNSLSGDAEEECMKTEDKSGHTASQARSPYAVGDAH